MFKNIKSQLFLLLFSISAIGFAQTNQIWVHYSNSKSFSKEQVKGLPSSEVDQQGLEAGQMDVLVLSSIEHQYVLYHYTIATVKPYHVTLKRGTYKIGKNKIQFLPQYKAKHTGTGLQVIQNAQPVIQSFSEKKIAKHHTIYIGQKKYRNVRDFWIDHGTMTPIPVVAFWLDMIRLNFYAFQCDIPHFGSSQMPSSIEKPGFLSGKAKMTWQFKIFPLGADEQEQYFNYSSVLPFGMTGKIESKSQVSFGVTQTQLSGILTSQDQQNNSIQIDESHIKNKNNYLLGKYLISINGQKYTIGVTKVAPAVRKFFQKYF